MDNDDQYDELIPVVLQDLQCFLTQKINQNLIFSMIQIKKFARKGHKNDFASIDKKSVASNLQKSSFDKRSEMSQGKKSRDKQSNASFDLLNGAQTLNQIRKNGIKQKLYTEVFQNSNQDRSQKARYSNPYHPKGLEQLPKATGSNIVPKLIGLVSSDEISDIQPDANNSRHRNKSTFRNYQRSIVQVDDDDDEFEDIVLNRLQKIEQKVNQMLRQKRSAKLHGARNKNNQTYYSPYPLQAVGSGSNIIYSNQLKSTDFYKHREPKYNKSVAIMSPRVYTFQNSSNKDYQSSSKKNINNIKPNLTERLSNPLTKQKINNYFTDNQNIHTDLQTISPSQNKRPNNQNSQNQVRQSQQTYSKDKTLGHYRQSEDTIQGQDNQKGEQQTLIEGLKIKNQKLDPITAFKYIPLSKINNQVTNQSQQKYPLQKTERQMINQHKIKIQSVNFVERQKPTQNYIQAQQDRLNKQQGSYESEQKIYRQQYNHYHRYQPISHQQNYNHSTQYHRESLNRNNQMKNNRYNSGRDSGVRQNRLQNSGLKAYTDHGNYQDQLGQNISISSQKNLYSQIQQLKQFTKRQAMRVRDKYADQERNKINNQNNLDYRYHQKTERPKYYQKGIYNKQKEQEQQIIIQGNYPQEKVLRVIKYSNDPRDHHIYNQRPQRRQYIRYQQPPLSNLYPRNQPIYVVEQSRPQTSYYQEKIIHHVNPHPYQMNEPYIQNSRQQQVKSHRKLSSGSLNSFKSIPYNNRSFNNSSKNPQNSNNLTSQYLNEKRSVEYRVQKPSTSSYYIKSDNKSQY